MSKETEIRNIPGSSLRFGVVAFPAAAGRGGLLGIIESVFLFETEGDAQRFEAETTVSGTVL